MTRKALVLFGIAAVLATVYVICFTGWFDRRQIQIIPVVRNLPAGRNRPAPTAERVVFKFDGRYEFTSIKVVAAADLATNKYPRPLWHLISDTHSSPTDLLTYGEAPRRMKPEVPGTAAEPLEPNQAYVLLVEADSGKYKGRTNFMIRAAAP